LYNTVVFNLDYKLKLVVLSVGIQQDVQNGPASTNAHVAIHFKSILFIQETSRSVKLKRLWAQLHVS